MITARHRNSRDLTDFETLQKDVLALKDDLGSLVEHLRSGAVDGMTGQAQRAYDAASAQRDRVAGALTRQVDERPIAALLVAFGLGFIGSRLIRR